ncbi:hypothetical protein SUDANB15_02520 [Streptomyces sp. enrichment culture]
MNKAESLGHLCYVIAAGIVVGWIALVVRDLRREMRRAR